MAIGGGLCEICIDNNSATEQEQEIAGAIDQVRTAIAKMQNILRHPTLRTTLNSDLQNRRRTTVRTIIRLRQSRDEHFGTNLFNDPAWNILLDAYASDLDDRNISVSDACVASGAPYTTALRWIRALEDRGLIMRKDDASDRRRAFVVLTDHARTTVESIIDRAIQSIGGHRANAA